MLLVTKRTATNEDSFRDTVHNYYERMVFDQILESNKKATADGNFFADVACVALNRLPPRYVRFDVDMSFFLSPQETEEMNLKVSIAVKEAIEYVTSRDKKHGAA